jgi:GNAT superfamily N-acetyltransferase
MRDVVFTRHSVRLAEIDGDIVGLASRDGVWLANLYVKPGWTSHGIGTQLLRAMLANAASATPVLRVCTFTRDERARRFLENRGFRAVGSADSSANEEHEPELRYERSTRDPI